MELGNYLKILKRNFLFIALFALGGFLIGSLISHNIPSGYNYEQVFFLSQQKQQIEPQAAFFGFEGFYGQEKARNFTDSLVAIIQSPDFKNSVTLPETTVKAQKLAPQVIKISAITTSVGEAKFQLDHLTVQLNTKLANLAPDMQLTAIGSPSEPALNRLDPNLVTAFAAVLGVTLSLVIISLKSYFRL